MGWVEPVEIAGGRPTLLEAPSRLEPQDTMTRRGRAQDICDDRLTLLDVHGLVPKGGTLEIHPLDLPVGARLLGVVFDRTRRSVVDQVREAHRSHSAALARLASRVGPFDFLDYSEAWRMNLAQFEWRRLSALNDGIDRLEPRRVEAAFERIPFDDVAAVAWPVWPGGVASFNLQGKAAISFEWWDAAGHAPVRSGALVRILRNDRAPDAVVTIDSVASFGPIEVDAGVSTVEVALPPDAAGPLLLRATTTAASVDRSFGDPPRRSYADLSQAVAPDLRSVVPWRTGPAFSPLEFELFPGELVQLTARQRLPSAPLPAFADAPPEVGVEVTVEALDVDGNSLQQWTRVLNPAASAWERYTEQDDPSTARVSDAERAWFEPAPGMNRLRVSATGVVEVDMEVKLPLLDITAREYDLPVDSDPHVGVAWQPHRDTPWQVRNPVDAEALFEQHRQIRIDGQVRLEWRPDDPVEELVVTIPAGGVPGIVKVPELAVAPTPRHYEPFTVPAPFQLVARPSSAGGGEGGAVSRIGKSASQLVVDRGGTLAVEYRVSANLVGTFASLVVGGVAWEPLIESSSGTLVLSGLAPGRTAVSVATAGTFLARAPGGDAWTIRKLKVMRAGTTLRYALPVGAGQLIVDAYSTAGVSINWDLQDERQEGLLEHPPDRGGTARLAVRRPASALSFDSPGLQQLQPLVIERGAARGELSIWLPEDTAQPVYVRILAERGGRAARDENRHWRTGVR
ncbi:MAG: hypothetical protein EXR69_10590 [Myxococcales bacterium]|nr:hypothetical protein [Myxococcales bacterium]